MTGDSTKLTLDTDVLDNSSGIVQIDAKSAAPGAVAPTLELKTATIDNGTLTNAGLLEATSGSVNTISHVNDDGAGGELFTNTGKLLVTGDSTKLTLDTDVLDNSSGIVQIDAKSAAPGAVAPTLELKTATIDNGTLTNAGLLEATSGSVNTISHVNDDGAGGELFTNTGKLLVTGDSTKLTLDTDVLDNSSGIVQIDAKSAALGAVAPTLELKTATIDNGTLTNAGLLEATSGSVNTISHVNDDGAGGELFTNTGKLLVTGDSTKLTLDTDVLDNSSGIVQIDAKSAAPGAVAPTLELKTATIDNGTLTNAGLLEATSGSVNTISHVNDDGAGGELFTNTGKLLVTGDSTKLTLDTDVLDNLERHCSDRRQECGAWRGCADAGAQDRDHRQRHADQCWPAGGHFGQRQHHLACQRRRGGWRAVHQHRQAAGDRRQHQADARHRRARQLERHCSDRRQECGAWRGCADAGAAEQRHRRQQHRHADQSRPARGDHRHRQCHPEHRPGQFRQ